MKNNPLVSIIINCYNSELYLRETVDSVLSQNYKNWELIFWDNQSTDKSSDIINSYNDKRIKYHCAPIHTSLGEGRNLALKMVQGELVMFLDADDLISPDHLSTIVPLFENDIGFSYGNAYVYNQKENTKNQVFKNERESGTVFLQWLNHYNVLLPSIVFKKAVLDDMPEWFDRRFSMVEEYDFFLRISYKWKCGYSHLPTSTWRKHDSSLSFKKREQWLIEFQLLREKMLSFAPELAATNALDRIEQHIAYLTFVEDVVSNRINRDVIRPYKYKNLKIFVTYITSFLGANITKTLLNFIRSKL